MEEEVRVVYNVFHEPPLGFPIALYFFMTGLSAGSFLLSTLAYGFGVQRFKPLGKIGVVLAIGLLVLAPGNLIIDLGQPLRFWHLFPFLNITSPITYGSFLLTVYPLNCVVYAFFMFSGQAKLTRVFGLVGIPLALAVHGYTGFILALGKARALWNTALMPFLFLVSAMVSGIALMILVVIVQQRFFSRERKVDADLIRYLANMLIFAIVTDMFLIFCDVAVLLTADTEAREAATMVLMGAFSPYFVGMEIFAGALVPLLLLVGPKAGRVALPIALVPAALAGLAYYLVRPETLPPVPLAVVVAAILAPVVVLSRPMDRRPLFATAVASALTMIGIMSMRYVMVIGGQSLPLS